MQRAAASTSLALLEGIRLWHGGAQRRSAGVAWHGDLWHIGLQAEVVSPTGVDHRDMDLGPMGKTSTGKIQLNRPDIASRNTNRLHRVRTTGPEDAETDARGASRNLKMHRPAQPLKPFATEQLARSEEHTSELQS